QRHNEDHETLEPHAYADRQRDDEQRPRTLPDSAEPERLNGYEVTEDEGPEELTVWTEHPVPDHVPLGLHAGVPGDEDLYEVAVHHDHAGGQHQFGGVVEMPEGYQVLELQRLA